MNRPVTLLITEPPRQLVMDIARSRPGWTVIELGTQPPPDLPPGECWGFVDWLLPEISGLELCRRLRDAPATRGIHLTMVLDSADSDARRRALQAGADDYVAVPLTLETIIERIEGAPANGAKPPRQKLRNGAITIDLGAHQVRHDGKLVPLRPNEFRLLAHFIENPDQVFTRLALIERLGKHGEGIDERTVDVWIGRLRRALKTLGAPDPLRTVRSLGYVLDSVE